MCTEDADVEEDYGGADESHGNDLENWRYEGELRVWYQPWIVVIQRWAMHLIAQSYSSSDERRERS